MKSVFLSILCSILLTNSCLAMEKSDSIFAEELADWDTLDSDDIQPAQQALNPDNNKKSTGWLTIFNPFKNSSTNSTPQTIKTLAKTEPTSKFRKKTAGKVTPASVIITAAIVTQQPQTAVISNPIPLIVVQNQEHQDVAVDAIQAIISIKKIPSLEKICSSDITHDATLQDLSIASQVMSPIVSPLQLNMTPQSNSQDNLHSYNSDSNSSTSSVSILMNRLDHSVEAMNIDRDSNTPSVEQPNHEATSLFTMIQKGCCNCFDGLNDSESKKKAVNSKIS